MHKEQTKASFRLEMARMGDRRWPLEKRWRDGPATADHWPNLAPSRLMRRMELKEADRLTARLSELDERRVEYTDSEEDSKRRTETNRLLDALAEVVMRRELGISKYIVLRVLRDDGFAVRLQVLEVSITRRGPTMSWWLSGRRLRKDLSIGERPESIGFTRARLWRRTLLDEWKPLIPLGRCRGLNDPYGR